MKALHIIIASALITGTTIKAAPALAQPANTELAVSLVPTADLDLSTGKGQRQLERRLATAAREVCGGASVADLEGTNEVRQCRDEVLARARTDRDALLAAAGHGATLAITAAR
jgi:UrcA family protein